MAEPKSDYQFKLLDRMIQRHIAEEMEKLDEEAIAQAIKSLLLEEENVQNIH